MTWSPDDIFLPSLPDDAAVQTPARQGVVEQVAIVVPGFDVPLLTHPLSFDMQNVQQPVVFDSVVPGMDNTHFLISGSLARGGLRYRLSFADEGLAYLWFLTGVQFGLAVGELWSFDVVSTLHGRAYNCLIQDASLRLTPQDAEASFSLMGRYVAEDDELTLPFEDQSVRRYSPLGAQPLDMAVSLFHVFVYHEDESSAFHWPVEDFGAMLTSVALEVRFDVQPMFTLGYQDDIAEVNPLLAYTAPRSIVAGARTVSGSLQYLVPYNELRGFRQVLESTAALWIIVAMDTMAPEDVLSGRRDLPYIAWRVGRCVWSAPRWPLSPGVVQQDVAFRGIRDRGGSAGGALSVYQSIVLDAVTEE